MEITKLLIFKSTFLGTINPAIKINVKNPNAINSETATDFLRDILREPLDANVPFIIFIGDKDI